MTGCLHRPVALVASRVRLEERRLIQAFAHSQVDVDVVDSRQLSACLDGKAPPYEVALIRDVAQVRGVYAALLLDAVGVPVVNDPATLRTCGDKLLTTAALRRAGLPVPRTALALTPDSALTALDDIGYPAVLKTLHGSWGRLCARVADRAAAEAVLEHRAALPNPVSHIVYIQEYVRTPGRDIRVLLAGDQPICAMYRRSEHWRANAALGARPEHCRVTAELADLARAAGFAVGGGILGVDLLEDGNGRLLVNEVNATAEFRAAQQVCDADIAGAMVAFVLSRGARP